MAYVKRIQVQKKQDSFVSKFCIVNSPELKAQVSYSDHCLSVVLREHFIYTTSSPTPLD